MPNGFLRGAAVDHLAVHHSSSQVPSECTAESDTELIQAAARSRWARVLEVCVPVWSLPLLEENTNSGPDLSEKLLGLREFRRPWAGQVLKVMDASFLGSTLSRHFPSNEPSSKLLPCATSWPRHPPCVVRNRSLSTEEALQAPPAEAGWCVTTDRQMAPAG